MIGPRTKAILAPNLIGNAPDWDAIRALADRHGLRRDRGLMRRPGCHAARGLPTGTRADISVTSFALSHIITAAGTGGMVCLDDDELADRVPAASPLGSALGSSAIRDEEEHRVHASSPPSMVISSTTTSSSSTAVGWNFEPSELSAAFGLVQLEKLAGEPCDSQAELRSSERALLPTARRVRAAPHGGGAGHGMAHVPAPHST